MTEYDQALALNRKEQQLNEKEAEITREVTEMAHLEEDYAAHFTKSAHLFDELRYMLREAESGNHFEELSHRVHQDSRQVEKSLDEFHLGVKQEKKQVCRELDDIYEEKQALHKKTEEEQA